MRITRTAWDWSVRLTFAWPHDPNVRNDVDAWLFGQWLLVSPVVEQGQTMKRIYLPAGTWIDWTSGNTYTGGHTIDYPVDSKTWSDIPLFIRAGAIIPTQPVMDWVGEHPVTTMTLQVFPCDHATQFKYYDDGGDTYAYEKGAYFLQRLTTLRNGSEVFFRTDPATGTFKPALRDYWVKVHGLEAGSVDMAGHALRHYASPAALRKAGGEGWATDNDRYGPVTVLKLVAGVAREVSLHDSSKH